MKKYYVIIVFLIIKLTAIFASENCIKIPIAQCCTQKWTSNCSQPHCTSHILQKCPEKKSLLSNGSTTRDLRKAPQRLIDEVRNFYINDILYILLYQTILAKMWNSRVKLSSVYKQNNSK